MPQWQSPNRSTVTPIIMVKDAIKTIEFVKDVFGAELVGKPLMRGDGSLWNAEVRIGDTNIMFNAPPEGHEIPAFIYVHVPDADAVFANAVKRGAEPIMKPEEQFYGEYDGGFKDAQGNIWWVSTHRKVMPAGEIEAAARAFEKRMETRDE
ncbi:VOC family protein [Hyphococcus sp.]|uniref:VOC family protein n=1 Tax=Hyphococcus sp. TaxID=2038636 RepID=UPI003CCBB9A9